MSATRKFLSFYRKFQYKLYGRYKYGVMPKGVECHVEPFMYEINHGDIVHPCVRYIPEGFEGHKWWMVYTPYYAADSSMENPILCFSDENDANNPPKDWKVYGLVNKKPEDGYNSDPTLFFKNGQLYVLWRENYEKGNRLYYRATFAAKVVEGRLERLASSLLLTDDPEIDAETCPCFMSADENKVMAYGMHLRFHNPHFKKMGTVIYRIAEKFFTFTDLLGGYSEQKHYGLAIWHQDEHDWLKPYKYVDTVMFNNCNKLYRPWHMDFFDYQGKRYCVVQTNQCNADIALAVSTDFIHFSFFERPLLTNDTVEKLGMYKPCAGVTPGGTFYLYYTAQDKDNRSLNKLYMTMMPFKELMDKIQ